MLTFFSSIFTAYDCDQEVKEILLKIYTLYWLEREKWFAWAEKGPL